MTPTTAGRPSPPRIRLRVLATTDLHGHVTAYDYYTDAPDTGFGAAAVASAIAAARAGAANTLLLDAGDFLQGNPMGDLVAAEPHRLDTAPHPILAAMNAIGIEASVLGNHDFNHGLDFLMRALPGARFPVVTANVTRGPLAADPASDTTLVPPFTILERTLADETGAPHPVRIGIIGFCPPQIMTWDARLLEGRVDARDMVEAAEAWVPRLRAEGADIVIALSHSGIEPDPRRPMMEQAALQLAQVDGIDALVCGHQHRVFPGPDFDGIEGVDCATGRLAGKPACLPGFWGRQLGRLDLDLTRTGTGWQVTGTGSTLPVAGHPDDPAILAASAAAHRDTLAYVRRPVGHTTAPLRTWFALVADCPALQLVAEAQAAHAAEALAGTEWADLPLVSVVAPFKAGGRAGPGFYTDIPAGPLAIKDISDLYLYPNALAVLEIDGAGLADWLERSAALFRTIAPGTADAALLNPEAQTYNFDVICGLTWRIDLSRPPRYDAEGGCLDPTAARITDLRHRGRPVAPSDRFVAVTNSYRAGGGGGFPAAVAARRVHEAALSNREVLLRHVAAQGTVTPPRDPVWRFAPMPGTTVLFDTAPDAVACLAEAGDLAIAPAGPGENGFARFRISL